VDALAAALGRLASDEALRATLRARGARRAQAFSPQSSAARVAEILARTGEPA
jgi:glycosyltransferase involved in cell wall biosynthesis